MAWRGGSKAQQSCVPATALGAIDTEIDYKLRKNSREQIIKTYSKMVPKSIQNEGSGASFWGVEGLILEHVCGLVGFWLPNACWEAFWAALGRF